MSEKLFFLIKIMPSSVETFFIKLSESILAGKFIKLTLSKRRSKDGDLKNIFVKPVELKSGINLQFVYRHPTKDITKNYSTGEALQLLQQMLVTDFYNADLFTTENDFRLLISKNEKQQNIFT